MSFFLDNHLSPKIARALNHLLAPDNSAHHLKDEFAPNTPDVVWMSELAKQSNWVIISADTAISRNPHEIQAWQEAGHPIFFLKPTWTHIPLWESASKLFHRFPEIIKLAQKATQGDWISGTRFGSHKEDFAGELVQSVDFWLQVFSIQNAVSS